MGRTLKDGDRVLIVEDVTTAGTSIRETVPILRAAAIVTIDEIVSHLGTRLTEADRAPIAAYRAQYGAR